MKPKKSFVARLAGIVTATLLAGSLLAVPAAAQGTEFTLTDTDFTTQGQMSLAKKAYLENDGTYTIELGAYSLGTTQSQETDVPCDIVLVLDQSTSMKNNQFASEVSYTPFSGTNSQAYQKRNALYYKKNDQYYKVTVDRNYYIYYTYSYSDEQGTHVFHTSGDAFEKAPEGLYTRSASSTTPLQALKTAARSFIQEVNAQATQQGVDHRIAVVGFADDRRNHGRREPDYYYNNTELLSTQEIVNLEDATSVNYQDALVSATNTDRLYTAIDRLDADGNTYPQYGLEMADHIFENRSSTSVPVDGESVERKKIVVLFTDGYPAPDGQDDFDYSIADDAIAEAKSLKDKGATIYTVGVFDDSNPDSDIDSNFVYGSRDTACQTVAANRYMHYTSSNFPQAESLRNAGQNGNKNAGYYMSAHDTEALNNIFTQISQDVSSTTVTLNSSSVMRDILSDDFRLPEGFSADSNVTVMTQTGTQESDNSITWGTPTTLENAVVVPGEDGSISVSGFDYSQNYIAPNHPGARLLVKITGILAKDTACGEVYTNSPESGIYKNEESTEVFLPFNQPKVMIPSKSYVLDYGKEVKLSSGDWNQNSVTSLDKDGMNKVSDTPSTSLQDTYGNIERTENDTVTYTPTKLNWNGVDTFYSLGKTSDQNTWAKINVMPANNVYYEDTFITNEQSGTVGIVYTGTWNDESIDGSGTNTENPKSDQGAWSNTNDLGDDRGDSDGTSHMVDVADNQKATASFTFTGTGVDVYSRTSPTTGTILVQVKNKDGQAVKTSIIDTKSANGEYYQVPTYSFSGEYDTYTVTINVTSAAKDRYTYYLDGIRVYNPIQDEENDPTVAEAYGEEQLNAVFTNARDMLESGRVAFIDEDENGNSTVGDYTNADIGKIAPKNEIYLAKDQSIVLKVASDAGSTVYLGMKSLTGDNVTVEYSGATAPDTISHTTDLYYKVTPQEDGTIVVKNMSENILSITKVRVSGTSADTENALQTISADEALNAVASFALAPSTDEAVSGVTEEELAEQESPAENETEEPTVTEEPENDPVDVVIENPEEPAEKPAADNSINQWINTIFNSFRNLFGRH